MAQFNLTECYHMTIYLTECNIIYCGYLDWKKNVILIWKKKSSFWLKNVILNDAVNFKEILDPYKYFDIIARQEDMVA